MTYCKNCRTKIEEDSAYCPNCGQKIATTPKITTPPTEPVEKPSSKNNIWPVIAISLTIIIVIGIIGGIFFFYSYNKASDISHLIEKAQSYSKEANDYGDKADYLYKDATSFYDRKDYTNTIVKCKESRTNSHLAKEKYRDSMNVWKIIAQNKVYQETQQIIPDLMRLAQLEVEWNEANINIYSNLFEACEYAESAAQSYLSWNYAQGDKYIAKHNEKIHNHDYWANIANDKSSQINILIAELEEPSLFDILK